MSISHLKLSSSAEPETETNKDNCVSENIDKNRASIILCEHKIFDHRNEYIRCIIENAAADFLYKN